jgi:hypothetical protein
MNGRQAEASAMAERSKTVPLDDWLVRQSDALHSVTLASERGPNVDVRQGGAMSASVGSAGRLVSITITMRDRDRLRDWLNVCLRTMEQTPPQLTPRGIADLDDTYQLLTRLLKRLDGSVGALDTQLARKVLDTVRVSSVTYSRRQGIHSCEEIEYAERFRRCQFIDGDPRGKDGVQARGLTTSGAMLRDLLAHWAEPMVWE